MRKARASTRWRRGSTSTAFRRTPNVPGCGISAMTGGGGAATRDRRSRPDRGTHRVIDEFPAFSYILGDNHPHVLAMPVALVVIGMALSVPVRQAQRHGQAADWRAAWRRMQGPCRWAGRDSVDHRRERRADLLEYVGLSALLAFVNRSFDGGACHHAAADVGRDVSRTVRCVHCSVQVLLAVRGGCGLPALLCDGAESKRAVSCRICSTRPGCNRRC